MDRRRVMVREVVKAAVVFGVCGVAAALCREPWGFFLAALALSSLAMAAAADPAADAEDLQFARRVVELAEEVLPSLVIDVRTGRIVAMNEAAAMIWRQKPEALMGMRLLEDLCPEYLKPGLMDLLEEATATSLGRAPHVAIHNPLGGTRYLDVTARRLSPKSPYILFAFRDVTEHHLLQRQIGRQTAELGRRARELEEQLEHTEALAVRLKSLVANAPFGIVVVDADERSVLEVNAAAERLLMNWGQDLRGADIGYLGLPEDELEALLNEARHTGVSSREILWHRRSESVPVRLAVTAAYVAIGDERLYHLMLRDVTEEWLLRHRMDQAYQQLSARVRRLEDVNERLREQARARSFFLATLSHELRAPLNSILGFCELLLEETFGPLNERQRAFVTDMYRSAQHLLGLLNNVLDIARVDARRVQLQIEPIEVADLLEEVKGLTRGMARVKKQRVETSVEGEDLWVLADEQRAKQVLLNLVSNALKYSPEGSRVKILARDAGESVEFAVADEGPGIPPEDRERIFDEFHRLAIHERGEKGFGLGLALARRFVELHGGRIWVDSTVGEGSVFYFTLPKLQAGKPTSHQIEELKKKLPGAAR